MNPRWTNNIVKNATKMYPPQKNPHNFNTCQGECTYKTATKGLICNYFFNSNNAEMKKHTMVYSGALRPHHDEQEFVTATHNHQINPKLEHLSGKGKTQKAQTL